MSEPEFHMIITKIYDSDGELVSSSSEYVPGEYVPTEIQQKYLDWLDRRRNPPTN